jgi:hypothetical protein
MTPLAAATGQLTGTQLEPVLLPGTAFPAGFTSPANGPTSSGSALTTSVPTYDLAKISCATFIEHLGRAGFGETAMVASSAASAAAGQAYDQLVYQFATPAAATAFVTGVQSLAARCGSFGTANQKYALSAAPGITIGGHPTLDLAQTGTVESKPFTLHTLLCASGVDVFGAAAVGVGAGAPAVPARETTVYQLMQRQAAAALLN